MNHYFGAMDIAKTMGDKMGGKGDVAILNAPPGIIIRDQRTNGFIDGLKKHHPDIKVVADQVADWVRKKAQDVFTTIYRGQSQSRRRLWRQRRRWRSARSTSPRKRG